MTWHQRSCGRSLCGITLLLVLAACGSDPKKVVLRLTAPEPDAVLTAAGDDTDEELAGLQIDVSGESSGLREGTTVNLFVGGEMTDHSAELADDGSFEIEGVTLPPGTETIFVRTATGSVSSDEEQQYTFKALQITSPSDGDTINAEQGQDGAEVDVTVEVFAIATSADVRLLVNGEELDDSESPDSEGRAVFTDVPLSVGDNELTALVEDGDEQIESETVVVEVVQDCPTVAFLSPGRAGDGAITLGGASCPGEGEAFTTSVEISTDAGNGRMVELFVNEQPVASTSVSGGTATFADVTLPNRSSANTLTVEVENSEGVTCMADVELEIEVDCAGPDCQIVSPTPLDYTDDANQLTLFLNASMRAGNGFNIEVESSEEAEGRDIELILDGRTKDARTEEAEADGDVTRANFDGVVLSDGLHTIEARCTDAAGNETLTGELSWMVDTTACGVTVTGPEADRLYVPGDDDDGDAANGTQVVVEATVAGDDCVQQRAAACDPSMGIMAVDPVAYSGASPLLSTVTLDEAGGAQSLCVEIIDRAANVGRGSVAVDYRASAPRLQIERPASGDRYNALGNDGYVADVAPLSDSVCDAEFWVACTELGELVSLRHNEPTGTMFMTGTCNEVEAGDPAVPDGFAGRAKIIAPFEDADSTAMVIATQQITGASGTELIGASTPITLEGDCRVPTPAFVANGGPCSPRTNGQIASSESVTDITVFEPSGDDGRTITLSLAHSVDGATGPLTPSSMTVDAFTFEQVDRGTAGDLTVTVDAQDAFANSAQLVCNATIVDDLPAIQALTMPVNDAQFGPGEGCDPPGDPDFGVRVLATVDGATNRTANVLVDNVAAAADVAINGQTIDTCVPVPDELADGTAGPSTVMLQLLSDIGPGMASASAAVHVATTRIDAPLQDAALVAADNCAGSGYGFQVSATIDEAHQGAMYTITSSNGGMLSGTVDTAGADSVSVGGCLPLAADVSEEGPNTITLAIGATSIARSVDVTVNNTPPSLTFAITEVELPQADDASYREGMVTARWPIPMAQRAGQLVAYSLRCGLSPITTESAWDAAEAVSLPVDLNPSSPAASGHPGMHEVVVEARIGRATHCVIRAADSAGQWTSPIGASAELTLPFRELVLVDTPASGTQAGWKVIGVGDVNDDGLDDVLVGNRGSATLVFGVDPIAGVTVNGDKTFSGNTAIGDALAGIGDVNGDGISDFAIADYRANSNAGRINIFFGRPASDWANTPDLLSLDGTCNADLCLEHEASTAFLGWNGGLAPAGDFDGDGTVDLAIGGPAYPTTSDAYGRVFVVLGGAYEEPERACTMVSECRGTEVCRPNGTCGPASGSYWRLVFDLPSGDWTNPPTGGPVSTLRGFYIDAPTPVDPDPPVVARLGQNFTALGDFDGDDRGDLVVAAPAPSIAGQLYFLAGRAYPDATTGLVELAMSDFGGPGAVPAGQPFISDTSNFGFNLSGGANLIDDGATGVADLVVQEFNASQFFIYTGDSGFDAASRIRISSTDRLATSIARAFNANLPDNPAFETPGLQGDLDGDGLAEICVGTNPADNSIGTVPLFYSSDLPGMLQAPASPQTWALETTEAAAGSNVAPATSVDTVRREVAFVGDVNGDGHPDLVVGDRGPSASNGLATLLY